MSFRWRRKFMAIEDLDLEFEDEEEQSKSDALDVDVDLSFSAHQIGDLSADENAGAKAAPKKRPAPKAKQAQGGTRTPPAKQQPDSNVTNISQGKGRAPRPQVRPTSQVSPDYANDVVGDVAELKAQIKQLQEQIQLIQQQADIKVAVANAEKEFLVEYVSNAKVMDHQVTQILTRINKKVPALATEVQTIKKYVNEFLKKSTGKKKGDS